MFDLKTLKPPWMITIGDHVEITPFNYGKVTFVDDYHIIIIDDDGVIWRKQKDIHKYKSCKLAL